MKFAHLLTAFYFQPWAIRPDAHMLLGRKLHDYLQARNGKMTRADLLGDEDEDQDNGDGDDTGARPAPESAMGVMLIRVHGIIGRHLGWLEMMCGGYDLDWLNADLDALEADTSIHTVIFDFNTPGGQTSGVAEAAARIAALGVNTIAYTDGECCSAGYYLASACDEILASPSATVGCIGVYIAGVDSSRAWEQEGLKLKLFRDGKFKALGMDGKEWTADEDAFLQARTDKVSAQFKGFVLAQRPFVSADTMQGQWFDGDDAEDNGLVDDLSPDLQSVITAAVAAGLLAE
jgi:protease-4